MPCNIPQALLNIRLAFSLSGPIGNITVGPGPKSVIGPVFLQFDWLTFCVGISCNSLLVKLAKILIQHIQINYSFKRINVF